MFSLLIMLFVVSFVRFLHVVDANNAVPNSLITECLFFNRIFFPSLLRIVESTLESTLNLECNSTEIRVRCCVPIQETLEGRFTSQFRHKAVPI